MQPLVGPSSNKLNQRPRPRRCQQLPEVPAVLLQEGNVGDRRGQEGYLPPTPPQPPPSGRKSCLRSSQFEEFERSHRTATLQFSCRTWAARGGCRRKSCHFGDLFSCGRYYYPASASDRNRRRPLGTQTEGTGTCTKLLQLHKAVLTPPRACGGSSSPTRVGRERFGWIELLGDTRKHSTALQEGRSCWGAGIFFCSCNQNPLRRAQPYKFPYPKAAPSHGSSAGM